MGVLEDDHPRSCTQQVSQVPTGLPVEQSPLPPSSAGSVEDLHWEKVWHQNYLGAWDLDWAPLQCPLPLMAKLGSQLASGAAYQEVGCCPSLGQMSQAS